MSDDLDAAVTEVGDVDALAEVAGEAVNLDALLEEGGEGGGVEDTVVHGLGSVDDELLQAVQSATCDLSCGLASQERRLHLHTFLVTFAFFLEPLSPPPPAVGFFCIGLSILLSSLLRNNFSSCALRADPFSGRRSGAAKRDTYRSLHHFVGCWSDLGEELVEIVGRKEMDILRRAELEGLQLRSVGRFATGSALLAAGGLQNCESWRAERGNYPTRRSLFCLVLHVLY